MKLNKTKIKMFLRDAVIAFVFWTGFLTPYMIFIVKVNLTQYIAWIGMQGILVPPLGAFSAIIFRWVDKKLPVNDIK
jgi:hypothetical protein